MLVEASSKPATANTFFQRQKEVKLIWQSSKTAKYVWIWIALDTYPDHYYAQSVSFLLPFLFDVCLTPWKKVENYSRQF